MIKLSFEVTVLDGGFAEIKSNVAINPDAIQDPHFVEALALCKGLQEAARSFLAGITISEEETPA